jgi:hypothetical protein
MWLKKHHLLLIAALSVINISCGGESNKIKSLESKVDSLQTKLNNVYLPGFGEIMSTIQVHHAKLWFAGTNQNWDLSAYELGEIRESFDDIQKYETARTESKLAPMIIPALDGVSSAITNKNVNDFEKAFRNLTNTCNSCHVAAKHEYNVIQIPHNPPFSNQLFKKE